LLKEISECQWDIVLLSAERLVSPDVDAILRNEMFRENLILLGIDEAHVLVPWGKDFRKAYHQIFLLRRRLPAHAALIAVSATISPGPEFNSLCERLGLKAGKYHTIRESSERPNVRMIFKQLTHGLGGYQFPDIAWVFRRGVKAVVYCYHLYKPLSYMTCPKFANIEHHSTRPTTYPASCPRAIYNACLYTEEGKGILLLFIRGG
jgi:superfamily II DNA helicase RecQ